MEIQKSLIEKVVVYVRDYMAHFDGSHDFQHIERVVGLSHKIYKQMIMERESVPSQEQPDLGLITLSALLHDVGDKKYLKEGQDDKILVRDLLLELGAAEEVALAVQTICLGVSYSSEIQNVDHVRELIAQHPELAVVQDADRLDAIGAIGLGRLFTYGGAKTKTSMKESIALVDLKLLRLEAMMKTTPGRELARESSEKLRIFKSWWAEEVRSSNWTWM